ITAPATGTPVFDDDTVALAATAVDAHDGVLTRAVAWRSSLDGALGTGGALNVPHLSRGTHLLTASVKNRAGLVGTAAVTVTVTDRPPAVAVTAPSNGRLFPVGFPITFTATAVDRTDGDVGFRLVWMSDRDGSLGVGGNVPVVLSSAGTHHIPATVTDSHGAMRAQEIDITITLAPPVLTVLSPADSSSVAGPVTLTAKAVDFRDGVRSAAIRW